MSKIQTKTGIWLDPLDLKVEQIHVFDIAHSLSRTARFMGHAAGFISVAGHSLRVSKRLSCHPVGVQLQGLLHDASEAYLCDIPKPLKNRPEMAFYREAEDAAMMVIAEALGFAWPLDSAVHEADLAELTDEITFLRHEADHVDDPKRVTADFIHRFQELHKQLAWEAQARKAK